MSTKTSIKRIAAVAAAALAIGGFTSITSAHAVTMAAFPSVTADATGADGVATAALETTTVSATPVVGTYQSVTLTPGTNDKVYTITTSGVGTVYFPTLATDGSHGRLSTQSTTSTLFYAGATPGAQVFASEGAMTLTVYSATAGTTTISYAGNGSGTKAITVTLTWGAARAISAAYSTSILSGHVAHANATATTDDTVAVVKTVGVIAGTIKVVVKGDNALDFDKGTATVGASISGPGLVLVDNSATDVVGTARSSSAAFNTAYVHVSADGTSGVATITITATDPVTAATTTLATETVIFTGTAPASIKATQLGFVASAAGTLGLADDSAGDGAIEVAALDSNGNPVAGLTTAGTSSTAGWYLVSDNTDCIKSTLASANLHDGSLAVATAYVNAFGTYNLQVQGAALAASGCKANVTVHYYVNASTDLKSDPIAFTVGGTTAYAVSASTDSDSYAPGQKVTLTVSLKDKSGNAVADGYYGIWKDAAAIASSVTAYTPFTTSAALTTNPFNQKYVDGSSYYQYYVSNGSVATTFYAPYSDGAVTLTSTLAGANTTANALSATSTASGIATALQATTLKATVNVANPSSAASQAAIDAAQEATDAANAAYDAANNAMDSADAATAAAQDASDNASAALAAVTSLSATVAKLVASVSAITSALASIKKKLGVK